MAVFTERQRKLTKLLITSLTGFRVPEENFKLCFQFCSSNFKYHRYLSVNDVDIRRQIDGLEEKFSIHSMPHKAHDLRRLTENFLSSHLEESYPRSDAHYGTLSFLLCMSDRPVHAMYEPSQLCLSMEENEVEWFDWNKHLMEGIEYSEDDGSSSSEWTASESEEAPVGPGLNDSAIEVDAPGEQSSSEDAEASSRDWLLDNMIAPYWLDQYQTTGLPKQSPLAHPACGLADRWEEFMQRFSPMYTPTSDLFVKEWHLVRETIWVLVGAEQSFVYEVGETEVKVHTGIRVNHLTPLSLYRLLEEFAACATKLRIMRQFCHDVLLGLPSRVRCRTYDAFASSLQRCLTRLMQSTRNQEEQLILKSQSPSLLKLRDEETLTFHLIDGLYSVFQKGVAMSSSGQPVAQCCTDLLDTLWVWLGSHDMLGMSGRPILKLLLPLWLETVRPYMDMLHSFVTTGTIQDPHEEFCVMRNPSVNAEDDTDYWDQVFITRGNATPSFLQPSINLVTVSGKSRHLMEIIAGRKNLSLQAAAMIRQSYSAVELAKMKSSFYTNLLLTVQENSKSGSRDLPEDSGKDGKEIPDELVDKEKTASQGSVSLASETVDGGNDRNAHYDPLMRTYLRQLQEMSLQAECEDQTWTVQLEEIVEGLTRSLCYPLTKFIQDRVHSHFRGHHQKVSQSLVELLRSEFNVCGHIQVLQEFFLFRAGATVYHFTHHIFQRELDGEAWFDRDFLSAVLNEALHYTHSDKMADPDALEKNLSLTPPTNPTLPPSSLCLHYSVPSPLSMLFSTCVMTDYNQIFQFLLRLHWAKWSLEMPMTRMHCATPTGGHGLRYKTHLLFLLRNKLLFFVNSLNTYLMTKMMEDVNMNIQDRISAATDLEAMIHEHSSYLRTKLDRCFLHHKVAMIHEAVVRVLKVGVEFRQRWERGVAHFDLRSAQRLEDDFTKSCHFLVDCFNKATHRGSFVYLEMLAFALQPLKTSSKIFSDRNCTQIELSLS